MLAGKSFDFLRECFRNLFFPTSGIVAIGGSFLGGAARLFRGEGFFDGPMVRTGNKKKKHKSK